jgi:leucyl/phenylalanyl-tRNA--protein transferase
MLTVLNPYDCRQPFPDVAEALEEPNGLLAVGGCLSPERLESAYRRGIFPWFGEGEPILWWSPNPRMVLRPEALKVSRSLRKAMKKERFNLGYDRCFDAVIGACAEPRSDANGTWITAEMTRAYLQLHRLGMAHSFEVWAEGRLVGGLYGVAVGQVFFGESMFHRVSNASKAALVYAAECLQNWGFRLIDCQLHTEHLASMGAHEIARDEFVRLLEDLCNRPVGAEAWLSGEQA